MNTNYDRVLSKKEYYQKKKIIRQKSLANFNRAFAIEYTSIIPLVIEGKYININWNKMVLWRQTKGYEKVKRTLWGCKSWQNIDYIQNVSQTVKRLMRI